MAIYTTRWFDRWARKQGLTAPSLCAAVREMASGMYDVDLGGAIWGQLRIDFQGNLNHRTANAGS